MSISFVNCAGIFSNRITSFWHLPTSTHWSYRNNSDILMWPQIQSSWK